MEAITYGQLVGRNLRAMRSRRDLSQAGVAEAMRDLGFSWLSQTVSATERASRRILGEELLALSVVLRIPVSWLTRAEPGESITLPGGQPVPA